jgi:hypothetical protein
MKPLTPSDVIECIVKAKLKAKKERSPEQQEMVDNLFNSIIPIVMIEIKRFYSGFETENDAQELGKIMREKGI